MLRYAPSTNWCIDFCFTMGETTMVVKKKGPFHQQQGSLWMKTCLCWSSWLWQFKGCESYTNKPAIGLCHTTISQWTQKPQPVRIKQTNTLQTALATVWVIKTVNLIRFEREWLSLSFWIGIWSIRLRCTQVCNNNGGMVSNDETNVKTKQMKPCFCKGQYTIKRKRNRLIKQMKSLFLST